METDNTPPAVAQPAPESLNWLTVVYKDIKPGKEAEALILHPKMSAASWSHALNDRDAALTTPPAAAEQERNFCPRCGKRTKDLNTIHTCTPPREGT